MKKSVILDIFNGVRGLLTGLKTDDNNSSSLGKLDELFKTLERDVSPQTMKLCRNFIDALEDDWACSAEQHFVEGFKLGIALGIECTEE